MSDCHYITLEKAKNFKKIKSNLENKNEAFGREDGINFFMTIFLAVIIG